MCDWAFSCCGQPGCETLQDLVSWAPKEQAYKTVPQELADELASLAQLAVQWFHDRSHRFSGDAELPSMLSDGAVRARIRGYQDELDREGDRVRRLEVGTDVITLNPTGPNVRTYQLVELPFSRQRALVERWERAWLTWLTANPEYKVTEEGIVKGS